MYFEVYCLFSVLKRFQKCDEINIQLNRSTNFLPKLDVNEEYQKTLSILR
jgi:hypothetical protein